MTGVSRERGFSSSSSSGGGSGSNRRNDDVGSVSDSDERTSIWRSIGETIRGIFTDS
jgi:hypothetical protein